MFANKKILLNASMFSLRGGSSNIRNDINIGNDANKGVTTKDGVDVDIGDNANVGVGVNERSRCE